MPLRSLAARLLPRRSAARAVTPTDLAPGRRSRQSWLYEHQVPPERTIRTLEGRHPGARMLIVGTGPSARQALPFDAVLHDRWDIVIALNGAIEHLRHVDYFLSVESKAFLWDWYHFPTAPGITRCVSESGVRLAAEGGRPDTQPALFLLRHLYDAPVDIRRYGNDAGEEGLLVGPRGDTGLGRGTVSLQAIHFASMLGASSIHLIGADLHFQPGSQHFYGGNEYGTEVVEGRRYHKLDVEHRLNPIVETRHPGSGETVETTLHFRESAEYIDEVVAGLLPAAGVEFTDLSGGLISAGQRARLEDVLPA